MKLKIFVGIIYFVIQPIVFIYTSDVSCPGDAFAGWMIGSIAGVLSVPLYKAVFGK